MEVAERKIIKEKIYHIFNVIKFCKCNVNLHNEEWNVNNARWGVES